MARETAAALALRVDKKQAAVNPKSLPSQPGAAQYIKYTPADGGPQHASGAASRIIKMQDMPVDPLEPPKFRHVKVGFFLGLPRVTYFAAIFTPSWSSTQPKQGRSGRPGLLFLLTVEWLAPQGNHSTAFVLLAACDTGLHMELRRGCFSRPREGRQRPASPAVLAPLTCCSLCCLLH